MSRRLASSSTFPLVLYPENRFPLTALRQLLSPRPDSPHLLTLYGPPGIGKSHLARHFFREATAAFPDLPAEFLSADSFSQELIKASQAHAIPEFQASFRKLKLLVCEDLQALSRRTEAQSQLILTIDDILADDGRVLLTTSTPPGDIPHLSRKLVNRCHGGLCIKLDPPTLSSRIALLKHFSLAQHLVLSDDILHSAAASHLNPRQLQALVTHLLLLSRQHPELTPPLIEQALDEVRSQNSISLDSIASTVSQDFGVPLSDLKSEKRHHGLVLPRQCAMFLARQLNRAPFTSIGQFFGGRNHTTVVHACQRIARLITTNHQLAHRLAGIRDLLLNQPLPARSPRKPR